MGVATSKGYKKSGVTKPTLATA